MFGEEEKASSKATEKQKKKVPVSEGVDVVNVVVVVDPKKKAAGGVRVATKKKTEQRLLDSLLGEILHEAEEDKLFGRFVADPKQNNADFPDDLTLFFLDLCILTYHTCTDILWVGRLISSSRNKRNIEIT